MKRRPWSRPATLLSLFFLVLLVSPAARPAQDPSPRPRQRPPVAPPAASPVRAEPTDGVEIAVATIEVEGARLFALAPVVARLGGRLEPQSGGSWSLTFDDERVLFGPDSAAM
ncbi:MAG TPA: hypothetical protein VM617_01850, partial [Thermoanaerobaculia bacterium]|nr:hypothetical protein [Thermoanaerobaculia bacterium]